MPGRTEKPISNVDFRSALWPVAIAAEEPPTPTFEKPDFSMRKPVLLVNFSLAPKRFWSVFNHLVVLEFLKSWDAKNFKNVGPRVARLQFTIYFLTSERKTRCNESRPFPVMTPASGGPSHGCLGPKRQPSFFIDLKITGRTHLKAGEVAFVG
jgi:hypothetical protein